MMYLAERRGTPPKDLGVDLLVLKEKRWTEKSYDRAKEAGREVLEAQEEEGLVLDSKGWFVINVDREKGRIVASHFMTKDDPDVIIKGRRAREIYKTILHKGLVGKHDHAAYLGTELMKAELALNLGRSYVQDEELF
jgi:dihydropteroate synthase-like protein